jgi:hypothetical protein
MSIGRDEFEEIMRGGSDCERKALLRGSSDLGWNPFKAVASLTKKAITLPFSLATKAQDKLTPNELKSIIRWTPQGLALRAGVQMTAADKKSLGKMVKWSPQGMVFRGGNYAMEKGLL